MPRYSLRLSSGAEKALERIARRERELYSRLANALDDLKEDPHMGKPLKGALAGRYSLRAGSYRIVYRIEAAVLLVLVIDIGHRRDVYR